MVVNYLQSDSYVSVWLVGYTVLLYTLSNTDTERNADRLTQNDTSWWKKQEIDFAAGQKPFFFFLTILCSRCVILSRDGNPWNCYSACILILLMIPLTLALQSADFSSCVSEEKQSRSLKHEYYQCFYFHSKHGRECNAKV